MTDYRSMWQDLGMDLETHDLLCAALPQAFGDIYLTQENCPEGMSFCDFVVSEIHGIRPAELIKLKEGGGKVFGTFCVFVPDEIVVACGGAVTGLCDGSQFLRKEEDAWYWHRHRVDRHEDRGARRGRRARAH